MSEYPRPESDFSKPWMGFRSEEEELSAAKRWGAQMLPTRRRGLTPSQRQDLADLLRDLRRERYAAQQGRSQYAGTLSKDSLDTRWRILRT